jgi:hypothetical protein
LVAEAKADQFLVASTDPVQISLVLLQNFQLILEKTNPALHNNYVYRIHFAALQLR